MQSKLDIPYTEAEKIEINQLIMNVVGQLSEKSFDDHLPASSPREALLFFRLFSDKLLGVEQKPIIDHMIKTPTNPQYYLPQMVSIPVMQPPQLSPPKDRFPPALLAYIQSRRGADTKIVLITDAREKSHGLFGDTKTIKDIVPLKNYAVFNNTDAIYGAGWFLSKNKGQDLVEKLNSLNIKFDIVNDSDAKKIILGT